MSGRTNPSSLGWDLLNERGNRRKQQQRRQLVEMFSPAYSFCLALAKKQPYLPPLLMRSRSQ